MNRKEDLNVCGIFQRAVVLGTVSLFILALIFIIVYSKMVFDVGILCPVKETFHLECPLCGGTRMAISLVNFELYQALRYNAFLFLTFPVVLYVYFKQAYLFIKENKLISWIDKFLLGYICLLFLFGVLRNMEIFSWLLPTNI